MSRLQGKVAVVTGAARGIGRAIAARFAAEGARLVVVDVAEGELVGLAAGFPDGVAAAVVGSVAEEATLARAVEVAGERFGGLDILVNNAYAAVNGPITELSAADWRFTLDVCLTGTFFGAKHAIPALRRRGGGAIVNLSSVNSLVATPGLAAYTAAKGAITALTRQLAVEYGPDGIRTNAIRPGLIATADVAGSVLADPAEAQAAVESCPLRRVGEPEDIADAALFLASDEARYVNGVILTVDGGTSAQWPPILTRPGLRRKARLPVR